MAVEDENAADEIITVTGVDLNTLPFTIHGSSQISSLSIGDPNQNGSNARIE